MIGGICRLGGIGAAAPGWGVGGAMRCAPVDSEAVDDGIHPLGLLGVAETG
ncbi:hypothetical protein [Candidatus Protofrankia californiensis]|uniref:hypothetical protein n=1 Tax=Candidatus Protofrankia californiensis TaxID=1839754 RepID=UPI0013ECF923|nr:hypothetical protein [Candidatus Protofrankia californiensis]